MSKKRSSRKRGGVDRQDYRRGGRVSLASGRTVSTGGRRTGLNMSPAAVAARARLAAGRSGSSSGDIGPSDAGPDVDPGVDTDIDTTAGWTWNANAGGGKGMWGRRNPQSGLMQWFAPGSGGAPARPADTGGTTGPKEGATKTENGIKYIYTGGVWVAQDTGTTDTGTTDTGTTDTGTTDTGTTDTGTTNTTSGPGDPSTGCNPGYEPKQLTSRRGDLYWACVPIANGDTDTGDTDTGDTDTGDTDTGDTGTDTEIENISGAGGTPPNCNAGYHVETETVREERTHPRGSIYYVQVQRATCVPNSPLTDVGAGGQDPLVDPEARKERIEATGETVAGTPIKEPQRADFPLDPEPQREDYPTDEGGTISYNMHLNQWRTKGDAEYQAALDAYKPGTTGGAISGELPEDAEMGPAEQVGYQRDSEGNLLLDENQNPIPLKEAATKKMEGEYEAGPQEAGEVTGDTTVTGTAERAVGREPGLDPQTLIDQWAAQAPEVSTDMSSPRFNPETGNIEKFTEDRGVVSWTPAEFALEFGLETGVNARTVKMKEDLIRENPSITAAELEGLSPEAIAEVDELFTLHGPAKAAQMTKDAIEAAKAKDVDGVLTKGAFIPEIQKIIGIMKPAPEAEEKTRAELTEEAAQKEAAKIPGGLFWDSVKRAEVKGEDAKGVAHTMVAETADIPPEIARTIVQDPATVEAKLDENDVIITAAVAALDPAILVTAQLQDLVGSLETGEIPLWAKPVVDGINQRMVERGLEVSTVGRDALFNAIITQAYPLAQSNATALQQRATQNLSNEQQAVIEQSRQDMTRRMANLANRQTAESQTAQMAQQMGVLQSQFDLETRMASEGQEQQVRMQNLVNLQEAARVTSQNQQQINAKELDAAAQIDLAELRAEEARVGADQAFENQERMSMYQTAADFMAKNAAFTQQMRQANMSEENQMRMANLASRNQAASELLSNQERTELANLNSEVQVRLSYDKIASAMDLANLSVAQERAVKNAATVANLDMTKFTLEQQVELANSKWMQTAEVTNMTASQQAAMQDATAMAALDLAAVDQRTKLSIRNAQAFLQMDMSNFNADQQAVILAAQQRQQSLLSNQASSNASRQFNATSENQMNQFMTNMANNMAQFNTTQGNSMEQFNVQSQNMKNAQDAQREGERQKFNAQLATNIDQFNNQIAFQRDNWNTANAQAVEQSNTQWRRQANTINTAAQNKINSQNAMNSFNMNQRAMSFLWQELRDQADFDFKGRENEQQRKAALAMAALGNESAAYEGSANWAERIAAALGVASSAFGDAPVEDEIEDAGETTT